LKMHDHAPRPRRSLLYVPAINERAIEKARTLPADMLAFDLEDSVLPDRKEQARAALAHTLAPGRARLAYGAKELLVRVNGLDTSWGVDDLTRFAGAEIDGLLLPKVNGPEDVDQAVSIMEAGGAPPDLALWCMIESARGVLAANAIAGAHPRIAGLVVGHNDLAKDLKARIKPGREAIIASLSMTVLAARAHRLTALDSVYMDIIDDSGLAEVCEQGRNLGFDGKSLIHPRQISAANGGFAPSEEEIDTARRIIDAHGAAAAAGKGVTLLDGALVENLHVAQAQDLLVLAAAITARDTGSE
jgi:citrate lyase subunit beta/citryl-CoA lyase